MIIQVGRYRYQSGSSDKVKKLCPLSLQDITKTNEQQIPSKMTILVKKPDYGLIRMPRSEPAVQNMLKMTRNSRDTSRSFIVMYVNNCIAGYKSQKTIKAMPWFKKQSYMRILENFEKKKQAKEPHGYKAIKR